MALQGYQVDFVLAQCAVGSLLGFNQHVVIQLIGKRLQVVPVGSAHLVGSTHRHQLVKPLGKGRLITLVGPLQQLMNDLYLVIHNGFQLVGLLFGRFPLVEQGLHLLQAADGMVQVGLLHLIFRLLDFQAVAIAPHQESQRPGNECQQGKAQQRALEA